MSTGPRYQQIKSFILNGVLQQQYPSGSKIPTEAQLVKQFGVSRMTVNKAIRDLVQENILTRHPGIGTFVAKPKAESPLIDIKNIAEEVRQRGNVYSCKIIKLVATTAYEDIAMQMGVPIQTPIFHSIIVHLEDAIPIQLEDRYVIVSLAPEYINQDFTALTPNEYLSNICPISNVEHIVEASLPCRETQKHLNINEMTACLIVNRRTWSDGRLVSLACLTHPGTRYKLKSITSLTI